MYINQPQRSNGRNDHWRLHMQGLQQLVRYYGGMESLYDQPSILQKIFRCVAAMAQSPA